MRLLGLPRSRLGCLGLVEGLCPPVSKKANPSWHAGHFVDREDLPREKTILKENCRLSSGQTSVSNRGCCATRTHASDGVDLHSEVKGEEMPTPSLCITLIRKSLPPPTPPRSCLTCARQVGRSEGRGLFCSATHGLCEPS